MKWEETYIKDICHINPENISRNYPYEYIKYLDITSVGSGIISDIKDIQLSNAPSRAKRIVRTNDSIIATVRPGNKSYYFFKSTSDDFVVSTGFAVLRPIIEKVEPRFLYYTLSHPNFIAFLVSYEQGANYPAITPDVIGNKKINLPPLPIQRKIASTLSAYDDLIENNLKRIKLLEEKATVIFKSIIENNTTTKVILKDVVSVIKGKKPNIIFSEYQEGCILYLLLDTVERANELFTSDLTLPLATNNDVLMCMDGARSGISFRGMYGAIGSTMAIWRTNDERINGEYLYQIFKNNESYITQGNTGAAIPHANKKYILDMIIPVLSSDKFNQYKIISNPIIELIRNLQYQNNILREARDILLLKLMNGEIEV